MTGNIPFYSMISRNDTYDIKMISGLFSFDDYRKGLVVNTGESYC